MRRRLLLLAAAVAAWAGVAMAPALAAVRSVSVGNFYFDDDTPGDGVVQAQVGDQLRFVVKDNGPGTPHTVEVDDLGIHSGSLGSGETFTTPVLDRPGTYRLYCKPHDQRGHVATLVVSGSAPPTTAAPTTAPPPPTTTATPTTAPTAATTVTTKVAAPVARAPSTTTPPTTLPTATGSTDPAATPDPATVASPSGTATDQASPDAAPAPEGRGQATADELADPADPNTLEGLLGRRVASGAPWTRAVRMGLALLLPLAIVWVVAAARSSNARRRALASPRLASLEIPLSQDDRLAG